MYVYVRYLEVVHGLKLVKHIFAGLRQCELDGRRIITISHQKHLLK